jgi:hypothetical protein
VTNRRTDTTRALWVLLGVVALGMLVGGLALARAAASGSDGGEATRPARAEGTAARGAPASALPPLLPAPSAGGSSEPREAAVTSAPEPVTRPKARPVSPAPATSKPRSSLYGRE